jgi:hypothetical protein
LATVNRYFWLERGVKKRGGYVPPLSTLPLSNIQKQDSALLEFERGTKGVSMPDQ